MHGEGRRGRVAAIVAVFACVTVWGVMPAAAQTGGPVVRHQSSIRIDSRSGGAPGSPVAHLAKKKKKKAQPAITTSAAGPISSTGTGSANATCSGKTHISGGGYAVSPTLSFGPPPSGLNSVSSTSIPLGATGWSAKADAFAVTPASGSLTTFARCESNSLIKIGIVVTGSATVPPGILANLVINCPSGTHVVGAGYDGTGLAAYNLSNANFRIIILQSRRTGLNEWTISAFENSVGMNPPSGTVNVAAICERDAKGRSIGEVSTFSAFGNNSRATGDPTCPGKQHVLSGGYALSPIPANSGSPPIVGVDEFEPIGKSTWHLGLHTVPTQPQPAGSSVATYAYCAKDTVKKKKKKKK
jgi:hypothetical protein